MEWQQLKVRPADACRQRRSKQRTAGNLDYHKPPAAAHTRTSDQQYKEASEPVPDAPALTSASTAVNIDRAGAACPCGSACTRLCSCARLARLPTQTRRVRQATVASLCPDGLHVSRRTLGQIRRLTSPPFLAAKVPEHTGGTVRACSHQHRNTQRADPVPL